MKKIDLSISRCSNKKCGFSIITEEKIELCPVCHKKMKKETLFRVQGLLNEDTDEAFITLKKRKKNGNRNRPKNSKRKK